MYLVIQVIYFQYGTTNSLDKNKIPIKYLNIIY